MWVCVCACMYVCIREKEISCVFSVVYLYAIFYRSCWAVFIPFWTNEQIGTQDTHKHMHRSAFHFAACRHRPVPRVTDTMNIATSRSGCWKHVAHNSVSVLDVLRVTLTVPIQPLLLLLVLADQKYAGIMTGQQPWQPLQLLDLLLSVAVVFQWITNLWAVAAADGLMFVGRLLVTPVPRRGRKSMASSGRRGRFFSRAESTIIDIKSSGS